jgi:hypothetical protein
MKRFLFFFLLILGALDAPSNPLVLLTARPPASAPLLLDESGLSAATAAYSVRKVRAAYSGSAIRVRRSSDNTEQDIGFSGSNLDTVALLAFVGAGDGFVVTWYAQIGSINLTQSTAANQPKIVSSGSLVTGSNGRPALDFDGTTDYFDQSTGNLDSYISATSCSVWVVFNADVISTDAGNAWFNDGVFDDSTRSFGINLKSSIGAEWWNDDGGTVDIAFNAVTPGTNYLFEGRHDSGDMATNLNSGSDNTVVSGNTATLTGTCTFGKNDNTEYFDGKAQEFVVYDTALGGGSRTLGRTNINAYYAIF